MFYLHLVCLVIESGGVGNVSEYTFEVVYSGFNPSNVMKIAKIIKEN